MKIEWLENDKYRDKLSFLLVHPPLRFGSYANVPLGMATLAAMLEELSIPVACLDYQTEPFDEERLCRLISEREVNVVGVSAMTSQIKTGYKIIDVIRKRFPHIKTIIGGHHATVMPDEVLQNGFDIAYVGEAEESLMKSLECLSKPELIPEQLNGIDGISYRDGKVVRHNPKGKQFMELDLLPFPARHLFSFPHMYRTQMQLRKGPSAHIITSRGCIGRCFFCSNLYRNVAGRSPGNVVDEMEMLHDRFGVVQIFIQDDFSSFTDDRIYGICNEIERRKLKISWSMSNTRAESVGIELFKRMKDCGCVGVAFGIESGSPGIRKKIGKRNKLEDVVNAVTAAKKAGLLVGGFYILGFPFETMQDMQETLAFAKKLNTHMVTFAVFCPFPGSPSFTYLDKRGRLLTYDWDQYATHGHLLFKSDNFTDEQVAAFRKKAYWEYHASLRYIMTMIPVVIRNFKPYLWMSGLRFLMDFAFDYKFRFSSRRLDAKS
jgi:anaerobic magnesium-protoporphyrin IX monomethyl ester cyclase